jgi:hypothetical protein
MEVRNEPTLGPIRKKGEDKRVLIPVGRRSLCLNLTPLWILTLCDLSNCDLCEVYLLQFHSLSARGSTPAADLEVKTNEKLS